MANARRLEVAIKAARQLGARQAAWYMLYQAGLRSGLWRRLTPPGAYRALEYELQPVFHLPAQEKLAQVLGDGAAALLADADAITGGRFRPYGGPLAGLRLAPPGPLLHWTAAEHQLPAGEDIKDIWEPARFGWAFTLGRAYRLSGDERYPAAFWQYFEIFLQANPPNLGLNWVSAQEVALRLMALLFAGQVFAASVHCTPERRALLAGALAAHAERIPPTISYAQAQHNNHLLSEGFGLLLAGAALPQHPRAAQWLRQGLATLDGGLRAQINPDGVYAQHSLNYHRVMLHIALLANCLLSAAGGQGRQQSLALALSPLARERLAAATHWLLAQVDPASGQAPNYGHNDGANLLPLAGGGEGLFSDQRPTVQAAARAFLGRAVLPAGPWDELSLWLGCGLDERPANLPTPTSPAIHRLGYGESWAILRAQRYTSRPAHADQLHVDLWWQGQPVTLDAGTYRYNAAPPWDNGLAATAVHNTLTVNDQDQMQRAGRFLWLDWAQARMLVSNSIRQTAGHDGFLRLGIHHQRSLEQVSATHWRVEDELTGPASATNTFRLHWLLPDAPFQLEDNSLRLDLPAGRVILRVSAGQPPGLPAGILLVRAGEILAESGQAHSRPGDTYPLLGWYSPTYGYKIPAISLVFTVQSGSRVKIMSEFHYHSQLDP